MTNKTSTKYIVDGNRVLPYTHQEGSVVDNVPAGYYRVKEHPMVGYYLERVTEQVELPAKIFGSTDSRCARIFKRYHAEQQPLGVGLFGKKGAGKSLLASKLAHQTIEEGRPVIDVSNSFKTDDDYLEFLNSINECTIIFDEFLKHISKLGDSESESSSFSDSRKPSRHNIAADRQDEMLNFFQGTNNRKRMIILIDNNHYMLSEFIDERPGRMRYKFMYEGVEKEVVEQLCENYGLDSDKTQACVVYSKRYLTSFDVINEVIREWSEYPDETLEQITSILNVPTLKPPVKRKIRVVTCDIDDDSKFAKGTLANELAEQHDDNIVVTINVPNPFLGTNFETDDDYYGSDYEQYGSWTFYVENKDKPYIPQRIAFNKHNLLAIRGNQEAYQRAGVIVTVQNIIDIGSNVDTWNKAL